MNTQPIISIIVPVFENSNNLTAHLNVLQSQTEPRWEAYYGFDGDLPNQLQSFKAHHLADPRIHIINNGKPATIGDLFNSCLDAVSGENIIILHAEDALYDAYELKGLSQVVESISKTHCGYYINRLNTTLEDEEPQPHQQLPHRTPELEEEYYPTETLYYLYKNSTIKHHNLRFRATNSPHLHEDFTKNYAQHATIFVCETLVLTSNFSPFNFPKAMAESE